MQDFDKGKFAEGLATMKTEERIWRREGGIVPCSPFDFTVPLSKKDQILRSD